MRVTPPTLLDGGLATSLQSYGLPPFTRVNGWLRTDPGSVIDVHRAFVSAGAEILLAGTFQANRGVDPDWRHTVETAVHLARTAAEGVSVWASVGPGANEADVLEACAWCIECAVDGLAFETFTNPRALARIVAQIRKTNAIAIAASLCPAPEGRCADAEPVGIALERLNDAGASVTGFNCGLTPRAVREAVAATVEDALLWVKPAALPSFDGTVEQLVELAAKASFLGGCCGTTAAHLRAVRDRLGIRVPGIPPE